MLRRSVTQNHTSTCFGLLLFRYDLTDHSRSLNSLDYSFQIVVAIYLLYQILGASVLATMNNDRPDPHQRVLCSHHQEAADEDDEAEGCEGQEDERVVVMKIL